MFVYQMVISFKPGCSDWMWTKSYGPWVGCEQHCLSLATYPTVGGPPALGPEPKTMLPPDIPPSFFDIIWMQLQRLCRYSPLLILVVCSCSLFVSFNLQCSSFYIPPNSDTCFERLCPENRRVSNLKQRSLGYQVKDSYWQWLVISHLPWIQP